MRTGQRARAFTLLEVVVATALTGALVIVLVQWVGLLTATADASKAASPAARTAQVVEARIGADLAAAMPCDAAGLASPILDVSSSELTVTVPDTSGDGLPELVRWSATEADDGGVCCRFG